MRCYSIAILFCTLAGTSFVENTKTIQLAEVARHAVDQSKLTSPGSTPFHLKAEIVETTNPGSDYKGEIDEYWVSPEKWRRTIVSPSFSQTLTMNGDQISEENKGEYFPWWLNDLATAIFDPVPMLDSLQKVNAPMQRPSGSQRSSNCARLQMKVGAPPAENSALLVFCFAGSRGLLESVITPAYDAEFKDYGDFKNKKVARRLVINPEPGTTIEAKITQLEELASPEESRFAIQHSTPHQERIDRISVPEAIVRSLSEYTPDVLWPPVRSGKTSGVLSMYISVDRSGRVREAWPLNSDNAGLENAARAQVMKWRFKPATMHDVPVQTETVLTFAFSTKIGDPIPILADEEARKLAMNVLEPAFPPGSKTGTEVKVQIGVNLDGTVNGVGNPYDVPTPLFMAASAAVRQWHFRPYLRNGKPDLFGADIVFRVP